MYSSYGRNLKSLFDFILVVTLQAHIFLFVKAVADLLRFLFISVFNHWASTKIFITLFNSFIFLGQTFFPCSPTVTWSNFNEVNEKCSNIYSVLSGSVTL